MTISDRLEQIPTNIITGFLGVGKTTAIQHLLASKPAGERWAVLVNEFGEVGIDGGLLGGEEATEAGIFIREVPGGCMCCTAGLPMQIALTMLLAKARPQRLLIEPTGLGHPEEVMAVLAGEQYREVLALGATLTLVDARKIADPRYTGHATFNQQLAIADVIVANKTDLYEHDSQQLLEQYLSQPGLQDKPLFSVTQGRINADWLNLPNKFSGALHPHAAPTQTTASSLPAQPQLPDSGWLRVGNKGDGFYSSGWIFDSRFVFDYDALYMLLCGIDAERLKAVFITDQGIYGFNLADGVLSTQALDEAPDSRIELIGSESGNWANLEEALKACRCT